MVDADARYVRKSDRLSWHLFRTFTRGGTIRTMCGPGRGGMPGDAEEQVGLPAGRTCETCFRVALSKETS